MIGTVFPYTKIAFISTYLNRFSYLEVANIIPTAAASFLLILYILWWRENHEQEANVAIAISPEKQLSFNIFDSKNFCVQGIQNKGSP